MCDWAFFLTTLLWRRVSTHILVVWSSWGWFSASWRLLQLVAHSCPTLWDPVDCSPRGSSVHGIPQARILEWVAISCFRHLPRPGIEPRSPSLQAHSFTISVTRESWRLLKCKLISSSSEIRIWKPGSKLFVVKSAAVFGLQMYPEKDRQTEQMFVKND